MNGYMGDAVVSHEPAPVPEAGLVVPPGVMWPTLTPHPHPLGGPAWRKKKKDSQYFEDSLKNKDYFFSSIINKYLNRGVL